MEGSVEVTLTKEIGELSTILLENEWVKEGTRAVRLGRLGLLAATNRRLVFLSCDVGDGAGALMEEFSYEEITNIKTREENTSTDLILWVKDTSFCFREIEPKNGADVSRYICSRSFAICKPIQSKNSVASASPKLIREKSKEISNYEKDDPSRVIAQGLNLLEQKTTWWKMKNSLHIVFALIPFVTTFLTFMIMGYRTKTKKYYCLSAIYFIPVFIVFYNTVVAQWNLGLLVFAWFFGVIHSFVSLRGYLLRLVTFQNSLAARVKAEYADMIDKSGNKKMPEVSAYIEERKESSTNEFVQRVQQLNIAIEDKEVSDHLDEIERICSDIFNYVRENPKEKNRIETFVNYYLPETFKLLEHYDELSRTSIKTNSINQTMQQITEFLVVIRDAFRNLYDSLYQDKAMHISADIKVLTDILTQHGLTQDSNQFEIKK